MTLGTSVSMVVNAYKNQYKLILLSSDILSFCFRDCCAQRVKLWSHNRELQPKDRSIAYALKQVGSLQGLKIFCASCLNSSKLPVCPDMLQEFCFSLFLNLYGSPYKTVLQLPFFHDLQDTAPLRISFTQLVKKSGFSWNSNYVLLILSLWQRFESQLVFSSTTPFFRG